MSDILVTIVFVLFCLVGVGLAYLLLWDIWIYQRVLQELRRQNQLQVELLQYLPYHRRELAAFDTQEVPRLPAGMRRRAQLAEWRRTRLERMP